MVTRPVSNEALIHRNPPGILNERPGETSEALLVQRMLPELNDDRQDRALAWDEWQTSCGEHILSRFVRAHNNTRETDDDIIQDALVTAYLRIERGRYRPQAGVPFAAYVVGIARNKIREARRRGRHQADMIDEQDELGFYLPGVSWAGAACRQPESAIERREQRDLLRSGISRLPTARRQVLEHYLSGASTDEIAARLAISEDLVRQHKCRGLRALQRDLAAKTGSGAIGVR